MLNWIIMPVIAFLAVWDGIFRVVLNIVVLPATIWAVWQTGNWEWAIIMFCVGTLVYERKHWCGGDVKLLTLAGAAFGWKSIIVAGLTWELIYIYKYVRKDKGPLPVGPFFGISSVLTAII